MTSDGSAEGVPGVCATGRAVTGAYQVAISPDGRYVYLASDLENGASLFRVAP